jgi:hypothetical protein
MKLDKDPFLVNVNMVDLDRKKVPAQVISGRVDQGQRGHHRMIKPKNSKDGQ